MITPVRFHGGPLDGLQGRGRGEPGARFPDRILGPGVVYRFHLTHDRIVYTVFEQDRPGRRKET